MGAWGTGAFDNDEALDWFAELSGIDDAAAFLARTLDEGDVRVAATAETLVDAAEVVSALRGHRMRNAPEGLREWLDGAPAIPTASLARKAVTAVRRVRSNAAAAAQFISPGDSRRWQKSMDALIDRLRRPANPVRRSRQPSRLMPLSEAFQSPRAAFRYLKQRKVLTVESSPDEVGGLRSSRISAAEMPLLGHLRKLEFLHLEGARLTDESLSVLGNLPSLTLLGLERTPVSDAALRHLSQFRRLTCLLLDGTHVTGRGFAALRGFKRLDTLGLSDSAVDDAGLAAISRLSGLTMLRLGNTRVTDRGLKHLKRLRRLQVLLLADTAVTDSGLRDLSHLASLQALHLQRTSVTGSGLGALAKLPGLSHLFLEGCPLHDRIRASIQHLLPSVQVDLDARRTGDADPVPNRGRDPNRRPPTRSSGSS
jgi:hypothetical protein